VAAVHAHYYTDPACSWSWSAEAALRRLLVEFDGALELTYVMGGIRDLAPGAEEAREWLEGSAASGMPVDARLWLEGGPTTSYPACVAVKAAAEQGQAERYLRVLREGFAFRRRRLDHAEAFEAAARELGGLDLGRFRIALGSNAPLEAFAADLERAKAVDAAHHATGRGRVQLPSLEVDGADRGGKVHGVYGPRGYEALREAVVRAGASSAGGGPPSVEEALRRFGTMATAEVAAVCGLPGPRAPLELWRLAAEWKVRAERTVGGEVWSPA
jgi:predicted DsbA family dithiol-disulfide isomerase